MKAQVSVPHGLVPPENVPHLPVGGAEVQVGIVKCCLEELSLLSALC